MKKLCYWVALIFISAMLWGGSLSAQEQGTYIDNASPQDSSVVENQALNADGNSKNESSGKTARIIGAMAVVAGIVVVIVLRKKKKK